MRKTTISIAICLFALSSFSADLSPACEEYKNEANDFFSLIEFHWRGENKSEAEIDAEISKMKVEFEKDIENIKKLKNPDEKCKQSTQTLRELNNTLKKSAQ